MSCEWQGASPPWGRGQPTMGRWGMPGHLREASPQGRDQPNVHILRGPHSNGNNTQQRVSGRTPLNPHPARPFHREEAICSCSCSFFSPSLIQPAFPAPPAHTHRTRTHTPDTESHAHLASSRAHSLTRAGNSSIFGSAIS